MLRHPAMTGEVEKTPLVFPAVAALLSFGLSSGMRLTCYVANTVPRRNAKDLEEVT